jgi:outer membrane protein TolC
MTPVKTLATPLLFASALRVGACTVGPDYRPPEISKVAKEPFREAATTDVTSAAPASSAWWELYSDPTLSRLIEDAFRDNRIAPRRDDPNDKSQFFMMMKEVSEAF